jgi:hypothetical protein
LRPERPTAALQSASTVVSALIWCLYGFCACDLCATVGSTMAPSGVTTLFNCFLTGSDFLPPLPPPPQPFPRLLLPLRHTQVTFHCFLCFLPGPALFFVAQDSKSPPPTYRPLTWGGRWQCCWACVVPLHAAAWFYHHLGARE